MILQENNIEKLRKFCDQYHVEKLYLFGSVLTPKFNATSDIDFLVKFQQIDLAEYYDNYMNFKENLKNPFGRDIDLVEEQTLKNPVLINSIDRNKKLIYG